MDKLVAVVTGGSNGIGEAICRHLLTADATVINVDIARPGATPVGDYRYVGADLSDASATRAAAKDIARRFEVSVLVNNAGFPTPAMLEEVTDETFDHGVNLHLRAALIFMQAFVAGMKARGFGRVVNMSSRSILGKKARTVYSGTKAALVAFTRSWALELGAHGITVNAIAPGPVATELFRKNNPPEVARKLVDLKVSDATIDAMKAHFSPRQIVDIAMSATYYGALGRMVVALGVDLDAPDVPQAERDWQQGRK